METKDYLQKPPRPALTASDKIIAAIIRGDNHNLKKLLADEAIDDFAKYREAYQDALDKNLNNPELRKLRDAPLELAFAFRQANYDDAERLATFQTLGQHLPELLIKLNPTLKPSHTAQNEDEEQTDELGTEIQTTLTALSNYLTLTKSEQSTAEDNETTEDQVNLDNSIGSFINGLNANENTQAYTQAFSLTLSFGPQVEAAIAASDDEENQHFSRPGFSA
ncbi:MAG: hypothetical protein K0U12_02280 [Gammaproteobacteria bacterium]|nr:hypothetical protein [Gammaproteobacteria bacterium]